MKFVFKIATVLLFVSIIYSCSSYEQATENAQNLEEVDTTPQIMTLGFIISSENTVELKDKLMAPGLLKREKYEREHYGKGDLLISFISDNADTCKTISLANPLIKKVDYSENFRDMQAKIVHLEEADFSVRLQYKECYRLILIEKFVNEDEGTKIKLFEESLNFKRDEY